MRLGSSNSSKERWSWRDRDWFLPTDEFSLSIIRISIAQNKYSISYSFQTLVKESLIFWQMTWCESITTFFLHFKNDSSLVTVALFCFYLLYLHVHSPSKTSHFKRNRETIYWAEVKFHKRLPQRNFSYYTKLLWVKWCKGLIHFNEHLLIKNNKHL